MIKIKDKNILCLFGIIVLAFFGIFIKMNYSVDTYLLFASQNLEYIQEYIRSGRLLTALMFRILQLMRFSPAGMYTVSFIIGIVCATFSIYILYNVLKKYIKNDMLTAIISIVIIINPFIIELWLFIEMGIMMLSILACILAYKSFDEYLEMHDIKKIYYSMLLMLIAMFSYQGTVAIFIALSAVSIILHSEKIIKIAKNTIIALICYGVPTLINFLLIMLIGNSRVGVGKNLLQTIKFILLITKEQLIKGFGLYNSTLFICIYFFAFIISIFFIFNSKSRFKVKLINILKFIYIIFMTYIFTIATIIPQDIKSAVMFPRNSYAYGSIIGLMFLFITICINNEDNVKLKNTLIIAVFVILLIMEFVQFTTIGINRYIVNYMDKYIILQIDNKIDDYEEQTGNKIENVAIYNLENSDIFYSDINDMINVSAKNEEMSGRAILELFMHRKLENTQQSPRIYNEYFKDNNWQMFDLDQIVLEGNTMHWYLIGNN